MGEYDSQKEESSSFSGTLSPWLSASLGGGARFFVSGKVTFEYEEGEWAGVPLAELERAELNLRPAGNLRLRLGRQFYRDNAGMIISGYFDGLNGSYRAGSALFRAGAFYTGLVYKKTAEILMTAEDRTAYGEELDYGKPGSYFASRRVFFPLGLELSGSRLTLDLTVLAQFDLNGSGDTLHSQYLETLFSFDAGDLRLSASGIGSLAEAQGAAQGEDTMLNFAASLGADWDVPGSLTDMARGELRWGSGAVNDTIGPFTPVRSITWGTVFTPTQPGILAARLSYTARPGEALSLSAGAGPFWRTDLETFKDPDLDGSSAKRFLGFEVYATALWAPDPALRFSAEGGIFFPGGAFRTNTETRWKAGAGLIVSL
jgi:hypothetical protein